MTIHYFYEGKTEKEVLGGLKKFSGSEWKPHDAEGKGNLNQKIVDILGPMLGQEPIRGLILRDLDSHDGETMERIVQGVTGALKKAFDSRKLESSLVRLNQHPGHNNVFTLDIEQLDFHLALHIAVYRWREDFIKSTIDDYILDLALNPVTAGHLAQKLGITGERLIHKMTIEIPDLLKKNGITLAEAKDYVGLYAAVIKKHTSPPVFAKKTMANAEETQLRQVFAPLLAAIDFVGG